MISVVIPAYNAEKTIKRCLDSLERQTVSRAGYEIIVVDDSSTDRTAEIVKDHQSVKLISQEKGGPSVARNRGVEEAKGDIILFIDADCEPCENWIEEMIRPFQEDPSIVGVKGAYLSRQKGIVPRFVQYEYEDKYDKMKKEKYIDFIDTYSAGFKHEVFQKTGGYDSNFPTSSVEDQEFSFRLAKMGYRMVFNPRALVYHFHARNLPTYWGKKEKIGRWKVLVLKKHLNKVLSDSHTPQVLKLQIVTVFAGVLFLLLSLMVHPLTIFSLGFFILFIIITIPFSIRTFRKDRIVGILSPLILLVRSFALGIGLIKGMFNIRME